MKLVGRTCGGYMQLGELRGRGDLRQGQGRMRLHRFQSREYGQVARRGRENGEDGVRREARGVWMAAGSADLPDGGRALRVLVLGRALALALGRNHAARGDGGDGGEMVQRRRATP